jgi:cytoskeletal protein RodZ
VGEASFDMESIGSILKKERELRQVSIEEMAQTTRIPIRVLQNLEADRLDELPGDVFVRGFVRSYARTLGVDEAPLLARYGALHVPVEAPVPMPTIAPPERGRRYGVTFAVVVLLVLFTLALSVVLRPRHRDLPMELSRVDTEATEPSLEVRTAPRAERLASS